MASSTHHSPLSKAFEALSHSLSRLESAAMVSVEKRKHSAQAKESVQAEITSSWQKHSDELAQQRDELAEENAFLKEDNVRLSNQLQALQKEYLELQTAAGSVVEKLDTTIEQLDILKEA
jgi:chromosome segregation ATPase